MKKSVLLIIIVFITIISCKEEKTSTRQKIEKPKELIKQKEKTQKKDVIIWRGYKPTGSHVGTIDVKSANFKFDGDNLVSGKVIFDMNTIKDIDLKDAGDNADLVNHLKSTDFFDVVTNPTASFIFNKVSSDKEGQLNIKGNLTLNGITKEINFPASIIKDVNGTKTLKSKIIKIDRTSFGVKFKSKKFFANLKDKFINDEFDIAFKLVIK